MYGKKIMEHFVNPRNMGELENPSAIGEAGNPTCGDMMRLYLQIEGNKIVDIKFKTFGCGAAIASTSALTEIVKGLTIEKAKKLTKKDVMEFLDDQLPPKKVHCSLLAIDALLDGLAKYEEK